MLRNLWNRLVRRSEAAAEKRETELEHMSPAERRLADGSAEDNQADVHIVEYLGGIPPDLPR